MVTINLTGVNGEKLTGTIYTTVNYVQRDVTIVNGTGVLNVSGLAVGEYASVTTQNEGMYSEFDDEIDSMLEDADRADRMFPMDRQRF